MRCDADQPRYYAVRRVNPFEGVLQVVEGRDARAYSPNGHIWQIQVLARRPDHTWRSFSDVQPIEQFFNFGLWDAQGGLQRVPANPVMDIGTMAAAANRLTGALQQQLERLPFPLIDAYECWATDYRGNPVALLSTTEDGDMIPGIRAGRWQATRLADHGFVSPSLAARGIAASGELGPRQHAEHLERQVRRLGQHKAWFKRRPDGSGERIAPADTGSALPPPHLPALGLTTEWDDEQASELASDYLAWQAPRLLTLQDIDETQRRWLERHACRQAIELAACFRLIPRIFDHAALEAARVEARLRQAAR